VLFILQKSNRFDDFEAEMLSESHPNIVPQIDDLQQVSQTNDSVRPASLSDSGQLGASGAVNVDFEPDACFMVLLSH
jgi:hypothetical protein